MNSLERTRKSIRGEKIDRIPTFPILLASACRLLGVKQREYNLNPEIMADTLMKARDLTGSDGIYVSRDNWVCHQALGGNLTFPEDDESYSKKAILQSVKEYTKLKVPDPETAPGMQTVLAAAKKVVREAGNKYYIQANIDSGPFSLAAILRGTQSFLLDIVTEDEQLLKDFLDFCTEVVITYGKYMIATGVHGIQYGDATASLISPEHYKKFVLPYQQKTIDALSGKNCDLWIHICGDTRHILQFVKGLNIRGFEVDSKVQMTTARRLLGDKISLKGNLDTTFLLMKSPEAIYKATINILKSGNFNTGIVMSPGCGVPRMTPLANLKAMVKACKDYKL